jgi:hypothetical protein
MWHFRAVALVRLLNRLGDREFDSLASVPLCLLSLPARLDMSLNRLALRLLELPLGGVRDGT